MKKKILKDRWFSDQKKTFCEIGKDLKMSPEGVRQIEKRIFIKIRNNLTEKYGNLNGMINFSSVIYCFFKNFNNLRSKTIN